MVKLADLLKWRKSVELDYGGEKVTVWVRVIGDFDLEESLTKARLESRQWREDLRNPETDKYKEYILPLDEKPTEEVRDIIRAGQGSNWLAEAFSIVRRPDKVEVKEVAIDPDAPTLEEMERVDKENEEMEKKYRDELQQVIETKSNELEAKAAKMDREELLNLARESTVLIVPYSRFLLEAQNQKLYRSVFTDKECKTRAWDTYEEFLQTDSNVRAKLQEEYDSLEATPDQIKN